MSDRYPLAPVSDNSEAQLDCRFSKANRISLWSIRLGRGQQKKLPRWYGRKVKLSGLLILYGVLKRYLLGALLSPNPNCPRYLLSLH